ncbi:MAG: hypothetical protein AAF297_01515 [Planctomycetota bacterium]
MTTRRDIAFRSARACLGAVALVAGGVLGLSALTAVGTAGENASTTQPNPDTGSAVPAPLEEARVVLTSGQSVVGLLISEDAGGIRLRVDGRELFVPAADVIHLERLAAIDQRYRERRDRIAPGDTEMRLALAEWLRDRERFALALVEAETALGVDPGNRRARTLAAWLQAQLVLENRTRARREGLEVGESRPGPETPGAEAPKRGRPRTERLPLLTPEQVNLIRVYEIDLNNPPRLSIPRPTMERLFNEYADHPLVPRDPEARLALLGARPERKLDLMFRTQARALYPEVKVISDPYSLQVFRQRIHGRWLVRACASNGCHGGAEASRLRLAADRPNRAETVYTNFLILERFRLENGEPLINHQTPEASAFLRAGLRPDVSRAVAGVEDAWTHPEVPATRGRRGWRSIFRGPDDARYEDAVAWIRSLYRPRPDYPIEYDAVQFVRPEGEGGETGVATDDSENGSQAAPAPVEGPFGVVPVDAPEGTESDGGPEAGSGSGAGSGDGDR